MLERFERWSVDILRVGVAVLSRSADRRNLPQPRGTWLYELENIIFCVAARGAAQQNQGKNTGGAAPAEHRPVSGIWAARRARAQRGPAQCNTWPSQVVGWAHRAHGSVAQRCPARTTMRRGPAGLPPGDQLLGCLGALAVRDV